MYELDYGVLLQLTLFQGLRKYAKHLTVITQASETHTLKLLPNLKWIKIRLDWINIMLILSVLKVAVPGFTYKTSDESAYILHLCWQKSLTKPLLVFST